MSGSVSSPASTLQQTRQSPHTAGCFCENAEKLGDEGLGLLLVLEQWLETLALKLRVLGSISSFFLCEPWAILFSFWALFPLAGCLVGFLLPLTVSFSQKVLGSKDVFIRWKIMTFEGMQFIYSFLGYF